MLHDTPFPALREALRLYRGLPRSVYAIFAATVINGAGMFVFPFLALYLNSKLGMSERQAGDFMFLVSISYLPGAIIGGKLADRFGRKRLMLLAQALSSLMFVPCGFPALAKAVPVLILLSVLFDGFADPARGAMQTDITTPENRQAAFSLIYLGHNLGFAVGPLVAGYLFRSAPDWLFWGNALAALAALALVGLLVPETKPGREAIAASLVSNSSDKAVQGGLLSALRTRPFLIAFVAMNSCLGFVYSQHRFSLPLKAVQALGERSGPAVYGSLMTLNAVMVVLLNAPLVALLKRFKPAHNVALAGCLYMVGFGMLAFSGAPWLFYLSAVLWTLGEIIDATNAQVYVANHTPMSHRGRFAAVLPFIGGAGWALSSPVGGRIIQSAGMAWVWIVSAIVAASASAGLLLLSALESRRSHEDAPRPPAGDKGT
jgi:MFS family permease